MRQYLACRGRVPGAGHWLVQAVAFVAAFAIAALATLAGISGALLLSPLQVSVLGTPSPAVARPTCCITSPPLPESLYRYSRQGQGGGRLALLLIAGTLPGVIAGSVIRLQLRSLGVLLTLWTLTGPLYILGGLLFGIATFRCRICRVGLAYCWLRGPHWPRGRAVSPWVAAENSDTGGGLALAWLGYALWSERPTQTSQPNNRTMETV